MLGYEEELIYERTLEATVSSVLFYDLYENWFLFSHRPVERDRGYYSDAVLYSLLPPVVYLDRPIAPSHPRLLSNIKDAVKRPRAQTSCP